MGADTVADVTAFHRAFGQATSRPNDKCELADLLRFRNSLVRDEWEELLIASGADDDNAFIDLQHFDAAETLDALVDLVYVVVGYAIAMGWNFDEAWRRVHASNMAKLGPDGKPIKRADGKVLKPKGWQPPDLSDLVK